MKRRGAMTQNPIILIGAGLAGVTSFYELAARGLPTVLIDGETQIAQGASFANGAVLHPSLPDPWNNPGIGVPLLASVFNPLAPMKLHLGQVPKLLGWGASFLRNSAPARHRAITQANYSLAQYSTRQTDALRQSLGLQFEASEQGTLKLFHTSAERAAALAMAELLAPQGLVYEKLDADALLAREPSLAQAGDPPMGALYFPDDRVGNARVFCEQLLAQGQKLGGELRLGVQATKLLRESGRVVGVEVDGEALLGQVVVSAGVGGRALLAPLGINLPVQPAKGYSLTLSTASLEGTVLAHPLVDPRLHISVTPLPDRLRILGMAEFIGHDRAIEPSRLRLLQQFFERLLPDMAAQLDWAAGEAWAGLRPMSSDGRPFIGATPIEGLWLNCGHGHLGWTMAVGSARLLADLMTGATPEIAPAPFAVSGRKL
jgi:D-amino-acid dehydrogenase